MRYQTFQTIRRNKPTDVSGARVHLKSPQWAEDFKFFTYKAEGRWYIIEQLSGQNCADFATTIKQARKSAQRRLFTEGLGQFHKYRDIAIEKFGELNRED